ncbi:MAG: hypothetical protein CL878_15450 [Dehalococcoidia bacterium]|nr:hypothetical protein [Dehalococcoidia bacterium]
MGSGHWKRWHRKAAVEDHPALDVRVWQRDGLLQPGAEFDWEGDAASDAVAEAWVRVGDDTLEITYAYLAAGGKGSDGIEIVEVEQTPCNFGGTRPWFLCACGARVALLYVGVEGLGCRLCYDLAYVSQREDRADRALRRTWAIRERLGASSGPLTEVPDKPPRMHHRTYHWLLMDYVAAYREAMAGLVAYNKKSLERLAKRLEGKYGRS